MSFREFEYADGKSFKFWKVEQRGSDVVTRYGRIGTDGQETVKNFGSDDAAKKAHDKLIAEKTGKGYVEKTAAGGGVAGGTAKAATGGGDTPISAQLFATTRDAHFSHLTNFIGERVTDYKPGKVAKGKTVYRISVSYDDEDGGDFEEKINSFLDSDAALETKGLVTGLDDIDDGSGGSKAYNFLVKNAARLPKLRALFLGDILQEEQEISWINQADISPLLAAFPDLEVLRIRGATGLKISKPEHKKLRALAIESGGLSKDVVAAICRGKFPELEYLELWLGTPDYEGDCTVNDLQPILKGKLFPKLTYLGLRNAEIADDIAAVIVKSPVVDQLETLDLSLGTLGDEGGNALLQLKDKKLKRLDLHRHFIGKATQKLLKALPFPVDLADAQSADEESDDFEGRFVAIAE